MYKQVLNHWTQGWLADSHHAATHQYNMIQETLSNTLWGSRMHRHTTLTTIYMTLSNTLWRSMMQQHTMIYETLSNTLWGSRMQQHTTIYETLSNTLWGSRMRQLALWCCHWYTDILWYDKLQWALL